MKWRWIVLLGLIVAVFMLHSALNRQKNNFLKEARSYRNSGRPTYRLTDPLSWSAGRQNKTGYPVDVVFTWVDGSDPNFIAAKNRFEGVSAEKLPEDAVRDNRWADHGELLQAIQSVKTYASWVRNIYVVTGMFQAPRWHPQNHQDVIFVDHSEIFGKNVSALPVFNSHAIEANIWRIPGLAEHFIYFNDDMFLGRPAAEDDFFTDDGRKFVLYPESPIPTGDTHNKMETYLVARINTGNLFNDVFGEKRRPLTHHFAKPMLKSVCEEAWGHLTLGLSLNLTSKSKFRGCNDVVPFDLFSLCGLETGRAEVRFMPDNFYIGVPNVGCLVRLAKKLKNSSYSMYCINDTYSKKEDNFDALLKYILETKLPHHQIATEGP